MAVTVDDIAASVQPEAAGSRPESASFCVMSDSEARIAASQKQSAAFLDFGSRSKFRFCRRSSQSRFLFFGSDRSDLYRLR